MRLAVFGGSYNPIHIGHLAFADAVCRILQYDRLAFVPAFLSPLKQAHVGCTAADRAAMVELAIADNPLFYCEQCELQRQGISYTIDTLRLLTEQYQNLEGKIGLLIGDDLLSGFHQWHDADQILDYADLIVGKRSYLGTLTSTNTVHAKRTVPPHISIENVVLAISSTQIRQAISEKKSWRYLVPPSIYGYITKHQLYE